MEEGHYESEGYYFVEAEGFDGVAVLEA